MIDLSPRSSVISSCFIGQKQNNTLAAPPPHQTKTIKQQYIYIYIQCFFSRVSKSQVPNKGGVKTPCGWCVELFAFARQRALRGLEVTAQAENGRDMGLLVFVFFVAFCQGMLGL